MTTQRQMAEEQELMLLRARVAELLTSESALRDEVEAYKKQSACQYCGSHHFNATICSVCAFARGKSHVTAHTEALREENGRLRGLLAPFAKLSVKHLEDKKDNAPVWAINDVIITVGDIRRAQAALHRGEGGGA